MTRMIKIILFEKHFSIIRIFTFYILLLYLFVSCRTDSSNNSDQNYKSLTQATFVGSETCISCHKTEYDSWKGSHHDQAMKIADSISILANFDNSHFTHKGIKSFFFKKQGDYYVNTENSDGIYQDYKIIYTFGVTPLQQYIVQFPDGHYQCLITAWDTQQNKWFHLQPDLDIKHDEWMHWSGGSMNWNTMCADCHSTDLKKNFHSDTNSYNTTFSEINVGCESCHGPASLHNAYYENPPQHKAPPKFYMQNAMPSKEVVDKCARCHSRRKQITPVFDYTGNYLDHYSPSLLIYPTYELDGQIRDEDYVYSSFVQSKMYHYGVSCRDCHDVHSLKLKKTGNTLCMECHEPHYNEASHHFHELGTEGAECINCHMPGKVYMGNDFRRDHSFRVPRPDQTVQYGTPNACNGCHTDESPKWASDFIKEKYGVKRLDHFSDYLLAGSQGDNKAYLHLINGKQYPDIARATAVNQYSNQINSEADLIALKEFLSDTAPLVRNETVTSFSNFRYEEIAGEIETLLQDSIRLVRTASAKYFNTIKHTPNNKNIYDKAHKEYFEELEMNADFATGQHQIAQYYEAQGNIEQTIKAYKKAIEIDNYYNTSRMNLALLLYQQGNVEETEKLYLKVIEQEPDFGYSYYMLGLLYNETGNSEKAITYLSYACEKDPNNLRAHYNYALKLQESKRYKESVIIMDKALNLNPNSEEFLYVKLLGQINSNQKGAYNTCVKLLNISPDNTNYKQILESLKTK